MEQLELFELEAAKPDATPMEKHARNYLETLRGQGLIQAHHELRCAMIVELSRAVGEGLAQGKKTIATTNLAKQLNDMLADMPQPLAQGNKTLDALAITLENLSHAAFQQVMTNAQQ
ncbi:hypothetical protein [Boudabousia marimammalium]|uniref:Uncharacterized protein n=1 Tax=Boudabousia marimammalium TaxID=156892 RepID=A0A1Q5PNZ4_9ACTO|nr:hypothetical protein [Boudabousia marimammalium]OKL49301.1 hypothetical protein BM477_04790 [Boudabousia marimammalium]